MAVLRLCTCYPNGFSTEESLQIVKFAHRDVFILPNTSQIVYRGNTVDECLQQIKDNKTDILPNLVQLNVFAPHVRFFTITDQSEYEIMSSYDPAKAAPDRPEVMDVCFMWESSVLISTILFMMMFWSFFRSHSHIVRGFKQFIAEQKYKCECRFKQPASVIRILIEVILNRYDSADMSRASRKSLAYRLMFTALLFLSFYLHFYFSSYIKTELVTLEKPFLIDSFETALTAPQRKPMWLTYDAGWKNFRDAPKDSVMHKLWLKSSENQRLISLDLMNGPQFADDVASFKNILIAHWMTMGITFSILCPVTRPFMGQRNLIKLNSGTGSDPIASVYNDRISSEWLKQLHTRVIRSQESGLLRFAASKFLLPPTFAGVLNANNLTDNCGEPVEETTAVVVDKEISDFVSLFRVCGYCIVTAFGCLSLENFAASRKRVRVMGEIWQRTGQRIISIIRSKRTQTLA
jgi:hypothetical protein